MPDYSLAPVIALLQTLYSKPQRLMKQHRQIFTSKPNLRCVVECIISFTMSKLI
ncbi:hypothetical protein LguiA_032246 [Lonicera macranthoides]